MTELGQEPSQDLTHLARQIAEARWVMEQRAEVTAYAVAKAVSALFNP